MHVGIATHDKFLVEEALELIDKYKVPKTMYEFQMLFGVSPDLRQFIVAVQPQGLFFFHIVLTINSLRARFGT